MNEVNENETVTLLCKVLEVVRISIFRLFAMVFLYVDLPADISNVASQLTFEHSSSFNSDGVEFTGEYSGTEKSAKPRGIRIFLQHRYLAAHVSGLSLATIVLTMSCDLILKESRTMRTL